MPYCATSVSVASGMRSLARLRPSAKADACGSLRRIYDAEEDVFADEPSDIYSLAMTIYALGILSVPFDELRNERSAARAAREGKRP